MKKSLLPVAVLAGLLLGKCLHAQTTINFDALDTSGGPVTGAALDSYLAGYGITVGTGPSYPASFVIPQVVNQSQYGGAISASSASNVFTWNMYSNNPDEIPLATFSFNFAQPVMNVSFVRAAYGSGISYPTWDVSAWAGPVIDGISLGGNGEDSGQSSVNVPAQEINLNYTGITSLLFVSDLDLSGETTTFHAPQFDDLKFTPVVPVAPPVAPPVIPTSTSGNFVVGGSYATLAPSTATGGFGTTAKLLGGTASDSKTVTLAYTGTTQAINIASDVLTLSGNAGDTFVLSLSYNVAAANALGGESAMRLLWLNPATNQWVNAVLGNTGGTPFFAGYGAYDPATDFHLGYYGVDTATDTVWAVVNHNSDFGAANPDNAPQDVPEPSTCEILAMGGAALLFLMCRRKQTQNATA